MKVRISITGTSPLLMSNQRAADPTDPLVRELKKLSGKRNKTDEDLEELSLLEFQVRIYHSTEEHKQLGIVGPYLPSLNIKRSIQDGAKRSKQGRTIVEGVQAVSEGFPIIYKGSRDLKALIGDKSHHHKALVRVNNALVLRTRPIFREWGLFAEFLVDSECLDVDVLKHFAEQAGRFRGLGDYRPEFGRYEVDAVEVVQET